ncbi:DUF1806 family protein, partial [Staphylococcus aureus]|uniref:DUF1806 family protein n=1 Tax=Staphylococcus aureus TaxID=1280 RepID=UPI0011A31B13
LHVETTNAPYPNHFHQPLFNPATFLTNIQITYTHPQLKRPNKQPYPIPLKLSNPPSLYLQPLTHFQLNDHDQFLIPPFNYEAQLP